VDSLRLGRPKGTSGHLSAPQGFEEYIANTALYLGDFTHDLTRVARRRFGPQM
jgi:hypothetical protein